MDKAVTQLLPKQCDIQVFLYCLRPYFHLNLRISCGVWIFCPYVAAISPNWLVLIVHGGGTFDSSITTVFIMLLVRREKSLLILVLKSSFEHLLSECHV